MARVQVTITKVLKRDSQIQRRGPEGIITIQKARLLPETGNRRRLKSQVARRRARKGLRKRVTRIRQRAAGARRVFISFRPLRAFCSAHDADPQPLKGFLQM